MPFLAKEHIPIPTKDVLSWACDNSTLHQNSKAIYVDAADPSKNVSIAQTKKLTRQLVAGFKALGLKKGDTVLIHAFNSLYYPIIVLGIIGFGGVFTGTNPSYTAHELKHAIQASNAKLVICEPDLLKYINPALEDSAISSSRIFALASSDQDEIPNGVPSWLKLLEHGEEDWLRFDSEEVSKNTPAMLLFSSGTTGLPKPAILSHYNLIAQHTLVFEHKARPYDVSRLIALPMFHAATAPSTHVSPLISGHVQYIMRRFQVDDYLKYCERFRISDLTLVPPMVTAIVSSPLSTAEKKEKLRFVKAGLAGAAPLDKSMQAKFQSLFYYPENVETGSVGKFVPNIDVKLIDDAGNDISGYDVRGELCVRGPSVIQGYMGVPREKDFDDGGYFRTGDILYCDNETKLWYIVDRKKELIKVRGFQVAPAELEGVLLSHPGILDAAVIGIPSSGGDSELPRAYIVKKQGSESLKEEEVKAYMEGKLAKFKRLEGGVKFVDSIPKTASGKILKRILRQQAVGPKL